MTQRLSYIYVVSLIAACLICLGCRREPETVTSGVVITVEAGAPALPDWARMVEDENAAEGRAVAVIDGEADTFKDAEPLSLKIAVPKTARYRVWVRAWWRDGCGNSIGLRIDDKTTTVGNDGTYGSWHWLPGPTVSLKKGTICTIGLLPREPNARIDRLVLATNPDFRPSDMGSPGKAQVRLPEARTALPVLQAEGRQGKTPFRAAVGGAYRGGWEALLTQLGVPCERLREEEIGDPDVLNRYRLICLSGPMFVGRPVRELRDWVQNGGILIGEYLEGLRLWRHKDFMPIAHVQVADHNVGGRRTVEAGGSPLFADLPEDARIWPRVGTMVLPTEPDGPDVALHGVIRLPKGAFARFDTMARRFGFGVPAGAKELLDSGRGPALVKKQFGKGRIYYCALPLGFMSMWRGTRFDPVARTVLLDAVGDDYQPLYKDLAWNPPPLSRINFADDFMRVGAGIGTWEVRSGKWDLTGDKPEEKLMAFALAGRAEQVPALIATGTADWRDYRLAASVQPREGECGLWATTADGARIAALLDAAAAQVRLVRLNDDKPELLTKSEVQFSSPDPGNEWHRLSLLARGLRWEVWLHGRRVVAWDGSGSTHGPCGLVLTSGTAAFDDVRVCDVSALVRDSDRLPGEEGSNRADPPQAQGLEPRSIYAPQWYLSPDPAGRHAVRAELPTWTESVFVLDGERLGVVKADAEGPLIYLPEGRFPQREIRMLCPGWRDYTFGGRLVDWYATGGRWQPEPRWSCDPNWQWMGVTAREPSVLWHRRMLQPPFCINVLAAPVETGGMRSTHWAREVAVTVGGNGRNLRGAFVFRVNPEGRPRSELVRDGEVLAVNEKIHLNRGQNLHHRWSSFRVLAEDKRLRCYYEGDLVFDHELKAPLGPGRVGIGTREASIRVARITLSSRP